MAEIERKVARVFVPALQPSRYKALYGGRGSAKSHFFAEQLIEDSQAEKGLHSVCIREIQKSIDKSAKMLLKNKLAQMGLNEAQGFKVYNDRIKTPGDGLIAFQGMQDHTADSIKSLEGFKRAWVEEGHTLSNTSWTILRPTLREPGSEIWASWNPRRKSDAIDKFFRGSELPTDSVIIRSNWNNNPWFTPELNQERLDDLRINPDQYPHVWEGDYVSINVGSYFARQILAAKQRKQFTRVPLDPLMTVRAFWDIGGTGAKADATAIWIVQFVDREIRILDYYEAVGQSVGTHLAWLRSSGYAGCLCVLPHDGAHHDRSESVTYEGQIKKGEFPVEVVPNQGTGAAMLRIEAVRRLFPSMYFDVNENTQAGIDAIGWYHEKKDEKRNIGLGPDHDWSSHACFSEDTLVLTRYGTRRIIDLSNTDEVLTSWGFKKFNGPYLTRKDASVVMVKFVDGTTVKCTPDHSFLTESGWKSASELQKGFTIQSSLTRLPNILTVGCIDFGRAKDIWHEVVDAFIVMFGKQRSGKYLKTATSIIKMVTSLITFCLTWNALIARNIYQSLVMCIKEQTADLAKKHCKKPQHGMDQKKVGYGINAMLRIKKIGQNGLGNLSRALNAVKHIKHLLERTVINKCIVHQNVKPLVIDDVVKLDELMNVWDINVPDVHNFSLANGAIVHNCDALGLMAVSYEAIQKRSKRTNRAVTKPYAPTTKGMM